MLYVIVYCGSSYKLLQYYWAELHAVMHDFCDTKNNIIQKLEWGKIPQ